MLALIANPMASSGNAASYIEKVCKLLEERGISYKLMATKYAGHATVLADEAMTEGCDGIISLGGDGTLYEVVNGLNGRHTNFYIVPCGTGNDFVKTLGLPKDPIEAFKIQLEGSPVAIDVGKINDRYFINVAGTGFDVEVLHQAERFKKLGKGMIPYFLGVVAALRHFKPMTVELTVDGKTEQKTVTILSVGNGRYFGGGMKSVPHADPGDGLFDFIYVDGVNTFKIVQLLPKFIKGEHTGMSIVHETRVSSLKVVSEGMIMNMDGELIQMDEAEFSILPGALTIYLRR